MPPVADTGDGGLYLQMNRNKRCLTLDLASAAGRRIVRQLVATADVVVANLPPATLRQLGLDYDTLSALNPRIVLATVTGLRPRRAVQRARGLRFDRPGDERRDVHVGPARRAGALQRALCRRVAPRRRWPWARWPRCGRASVAAAASWSKARCCAARWCMGNAVLIEQALDGAEPRAAGQPRLHGRAERPVPRAPTAGWWCRPSASRCSSAGARWSAAPELVDDPRFADDEQRGDHGADISALMADWCAERDRATQVLAGAGRGQDPGRAGAQPAAGAGRPAHPRRRAAAAAADQRQHAARADRAAPGAMSADPAVFARRAPAWASTRRRSWPRWATTLRPWPS